MHPAATEPHRGHRLRPAPAPRAILRAGEAVPPGGNKVLQEGGQLPGLRLGRVDATLLAYASRATELQSIRPSARVMCRAGAGRGGRPGSAATPARPRRHQPRPRRPGGDVRRTARVAAGFRLRASPQPRHPETRSLRRQRAMSTSGSHSRGVGQSVSWCRCLLDKSSNCCCIQCQKTYSFAFSALDGGTDIST